MPNIRCPTASAAAALRCARPIYARAATGTSACRRSPVARPSFGSLHPSCSRRTSTAGTSATPMSPSVVAPSTAPSPRAHRRGTGRAREEPRAPCGWRRPRCWERRHSRSQRAMQRRAARQGQNCLGPPQECSCIGNESDRARTRIVLRLRTRRVAPRSGFWRARGHRSDSGLTARLLPKSNGLRRVLLAQSSPATSRRARRVLRRPFPLLDHRLGFASRK